MGINFGNFTLCTDQNKIQFSDKRNIIYYRCGEVLMAKGSLPLKQGFALASTLALGLTVYLGVFRPALVQRRNKNIGTEIQQFLKSREEKCASEGKK